MTEQKIRIITHSAGFHADDVFAVATLSLLLGPENIEVVRTRDPELIATGEYVVDVGFVYDESTNRFDHHQEAGAGMRANGMPYASFGIVWKKYGAQVCGSEDIAQRIDARLVQQIDAYDNGVQTFTLDERRVSPFLLQSVIHLFEPMAGEQKTNDEGFMEAVALARMVLTRLILSVQEDVAVEQMTEQAYQNADDKRLIVFEGDDVNRTIISLHLGTHADTVYFVRRHGDGKWQLVSVANPPSPFDNRKPLPEAWRGKDGEELQRVTGVADALFCHRGGFMAVAETKEGAIALAQLALAE